MSDRILLHDLRVDAICGVLPHERTTRQPLRIDIEIEADLSAARASDVLDDTIDYGAVTAEAERVATTLEPQLLERMADAIAEAVLGCDARAASVAVTVTKLEPPVPQRLATSGVRVTRSR